MSELPLTQDHELVLSKVLHDYRAAISNMQSVANILTSGTFVVTQAELEKLSALMNKTVDRSLIDFEINKSALIRALAL